MKNYGKVVKYNGLYGNIKGVDGIDYVLLDKNLIDKDVNVFDNVEFEAEEYKTPEVDIQVARLVKSLTKEQEQRRQK